MSEESGKSSYRWGMDFIFDRVDEERAYQEQRWPGHKHTVGAYLTYMDRYLREASEKSLGEEPRTLEPLRKFLALAVVCMEENGLVRRGAGSLGVQGSPTRAEVYQAILEERAYQDEVVANLYGEGVKSREVGAELTLARGYMRWADAAWIKGVGDRDVLAQIRKLAAIAVRTFQNHGCPSRVVEIRRPIIGQPY